MGGADWIVSITSRARMFAHPGPSAYWGPAFARQPPHPLLAGDLDDLDHEAGESDAEHRDRNCGLDLYRNHLLAAARLAARCALAALEAGGKREVIALAVPSMFC